jgi:hypothetical protein
VIGGWRWIPSRSGSSQLMLYLGSPPTTAMALAPLGERPGADLLLLRARPRPLAERGLLPALLPELVQQAGQLQIQASGRQGKGSEAAFSLLTGQLQVPPPLSRNGFLHQFHGLGHFFQVAGVLA